MTRALNAGAPLGYTAALGLPPLRERIARLYRDRCGISLDPERVIVTAGSSAGFLLSFLALFDKGQRVAIADPSCPSYRNILRALCLNPVRLEASEETRFQSAPHLIADAERGGRIDGVLLAAPSNPAGTILDKNAMIDLVEECQRIDAALISDEIYHGLTYGPRAVSALEITDHVFAINSFSKYFSPAFPKQLDIFASPITRNVLCFSTLIGLKVADYGSPGGCARNRCWAAWF